MPELDLHHKIEFNPDRIFTDPSDLVSDWIDISGWVDWIKGVDETVGGQDESSQVSPSKIVFYLDNTDGRFLPENTAGAYYPNFVEPLWCRFSIVDPGNGIDVVRFTGIIHDILPDYVGPNAHRQVQITASNQMRRMQKFRTIASFLQEEVMLDKPIAYYPMDDGRDAVSFADQSGNSQPPLQVYGIGALGTIDPGGADGPPATGQTAPDFKPVYPQLAAGYQTQGKYLRTVLSKPLTIGAGHPYTIEWWMKLNDYGASDSSDNSFRYYPGVNTIPPSSGGLIGGYYTTPNHTESNVSGGPSVYWEGGQVNLYDGDNLSTSQSHGFGGHMVPGIWYHFAVVSDGSSPLTSDSGKYYQNGHLQQCKGTGSMDPPTLTVQNCAEWFLGGLPALGTGLLSGSLAHFALYDTELSQERLLEHYIAGRTGFAGEELCARAGRIVGYSGNPGYNSSNPIGPDFPRQPVVAQDGAKALDLLNQLEVTEQGRFFIDALGNPQFYDRSHRYTSTVLTLSAAPGTGDVSPGGLQPVRDDQRFLNDVKTTTGIGTVYRAINQASITNDGIYDAAITTVGASPTNADETARLVLASRSVKQSRYPSVTVDLTGRVTNTALTNAVLAAGIWDRIAITGVVTGFAVPEVVIEGWSAKWAAEEKSVTFNLTPNIPQPQVYKVGVAGSDEVTTSAARLGF